ncbi:hypothetical protein BJF78_16685 [Pseudonocardia sp. CNS-139]|nr:hypothetical protein BJF78_16685 [Pseudonocardia sp. CNS-139]
MAAPTAAPTAAPMPAPVPLADAGSPHVPAMARLAPHDPAPMPVPMPVPMPTPPAPMRPAQAAPAETHPYTAVTPDPLYDTPRAQPMRYPPADRTQQPAGPADPAAVPEPAKAPEAERTEHPTPHPYL